MTLSDKRHAGSVNTSAIPHPEDLELTNKWEIIHQDQKLATAFFGRPVGEDNLKNLYGLPAATFEQLALSLPWESVYNDSGVILRHSCWLTIAGCICKYYYSPKEWQPSPCPDWLNTFTDKVLSLCGVTDRPHGINCNLFDDGIQALGWHSDNEPLFGQMKSFRSIISLSLGADRLFEIRRNLAKDTMEVNLSSGDLLITTDVAQKFVQHRITYDPSVRKRRFNFTWRFLHHNHICAHAGTQVYNDFLIPS